MGIHPPPERDRLPALAVVLDVSSSMTADDFAPQNRLEEAKKHLKEFISSAGEVELGLILFAASPQLAVPVTFDHDAVRDALQKARTAGFNNDGTALGSAIASAVNRLRDGPWSKRRILLITDGVNNSGPVSPLDAARIASAFGITIDAIGIGTDSVSRFWIPTQDESFAELEARIEIDDKMLADLTRETAGTYHRVRNSSELREALRSLERLPAPPASVQSAAARFRWSRILSIAAILLLAVEFLLSRFTFSELPG